MNLSLDCAHFKIIYGLLFLLKHRKFLCNSSHSFFNIPKTTFTSFFFKYSIPFPFTFLLLSRVPITTLGILYLDIVLQQGGVFPK